VRYATVCSGIEAPSVAWSGLGWQPEFFSEIEAFPSAVLSAHYPEVPNRGDMKRFKEWPDGSVDLVCAGTPCQSFSVAGLRGGLADPRGNLTLVYLGLLERLRPRWMVWENVPGVLSDRSGAFGAFLGGLAELGYGFAYRVLDARYFGVPQRRRRVFVVGYLGDWRRAAAVLFERASLCGDPAPREEAGQDVAGSLGGSSQSGGFRTTDLDNHGAFIPMISHALSNRDGKGPCSNLAQATMVAVLADPVLANQANTYTREGKNNFRLAGVAFAENQRAEVITSDTAGALKVGGGKPGQGYPAVQHAAAVRRLTPRECERLQGFPDDYTLIPYRGGLAKDGPRYKALGNSMAVPVLRWIGDRISLVDSLT